MPPKLKRLITKLNNLKLNPSEPATRPPRTRRPTRNAERRLDDHAIQTLLDSYSSGATVVDIMQSYELGRGTVLSILRRHGIQLRNQGLAQHDIPTAAKLYEQGWSPSRVGERFGCDPETIRKRLHEYGVSIRRRNGY